MSNNILDFRLEQEWKQFKKDHPHVSVLFVKGEDRFKLMRLIRARAYVNRIKPATYAEVHPSELIEERPIV